MRIVHDLKNPLLGSKYRTEELIESLNNTQNIDSNELTMMVDELTEAINMTEEIRIGFKAKNSMKLDETKSELVLSNLIQSIKQSNNTLTVKTCNNLHLSVDEYTYNNYNIINVQITLLKRILNNLISNSLKHTYNKNVYMNIYNSKLKLLRDL